MLKSPNYKATREDAGVLAVSPAFPSFPPPMNAELRSLPSVDRMLADQRLGALAGAYSHAAVTAVVRIHLEAARTAIMDGGAAPSYDALVAAVLAYAEDTWTPWPRRAINATGVVLHTNLGRAPLSPAAISAIEDVCRGYSDLELDITTGRRGSRHSRISQLLAQATGAEAGMAVNNNAAAVLLGLAAIAAGKEVIVSRGQAVEIGGGFRIPAVLAQSGAILVEVGTTNRTYISDYEAAISDRAGAILVVHPSNFSLTGFTHNPGLADLVALGRAHRLPVLHDLGSGALLDTTALGMAHEPTAQESVAAGADLVFFSGDKLLGGPQAGIIIGRSSLVLEVSRHPLARAVRIDKTGLAALSATLGSYVRGTATQDVPIWQMLAATEGQLRTRAQSWKEAIGQGQIMAARSTIGGGSLPGQTLPTAVLLISHPAGPDTLSRRLRRASTTPIIARIEDDYVALDPRAVVPAEDKLVISGLTNALATDGPR